MSTTVTFTGLEELIADLRNLPADLATDASSIVIGAATTAFNEIHDKYPEVSGNLRKGLKLQVREIGPYGTGMQVISGAHHALLFELGSAMRFYTGTDSRGHVSSHAARGRMPVFAPPGRVFVPTVIRRRREMYVALKALLVTHGARVSGDAV